MRYRYSIPEPLPWNTIAGPLAAAEDGLARLDQQLAKSPIREGWIARTHFTDAAACLWLEGELVHLEDLVLHDAHMDVRAPTHELIRAHAVLRARRRIAEVEPDWALSPAGIAGLRAPASDVDRAEEDSDLSDNGDDPQDESNDDGDLSAATASLETDDPLAEAFAAIDAAIANTDRVLINGARHRQSPDDSTPAEIVSRPTRDPLVYDPDWNEDERLAAWHAIIDQTRTLPPTLAAAIAADAWDATEPLQRAPWIGRLLSAALLCQRGKTRAHLACLHQGLRLIVHERRRPHDPAGRIAVQLEAMTLAANAGLKDHDRWMTARTLLMRKLNGRRSTSRLPALLDYALTRPIVSARMIASELRISPYAAQNLVAELGLRETTGRRRYRAWGIL